MGDRYRLLPGSALEVPFGEGYSLVLLPNFLHHFDPPTCEGILRKCRAALAPDGRLVIVEFVPDDDRSGPPDAVRFALVMLASTPAGDAYTFTELESMLRNAGFAAMTRHDLVPSPARVIIARR
jgi:SAM-dependent methyltransferase